MSLYDYILSPIIVFIVGYTLLRLMGKKAVTEMTMFDLLAVLVVGNIITTPITSNQLGLATYYSLAIAIIYIVFARLKLINKIRPIMTPSSTVLIRSGEIIEHALKKERMTVSEIISSLRVKGYTNVEDIEMMTIESTGKISIIPKSDKRPLQANDLQVTPSPTFVEIPLVIDGEIIDHNLNFLHLDYRWLWNQLMAYNLNEGNLSEITLATYNQQGFVDVDITSKKQNEGPNGYKPGRN
ncbi:DUF421 domain-containing protein [Aquibacillus saliphilus]|uniref:DUF421 domain-containing protein n=1 Tax=Aquibacillus saliphilus TaxID=1909422 RepID=UPI001CF06FC4|nr:DUF421 domain-containing protein [Aquibacillus saliphilus]